MVGVQAALCRNNISLVRFSVIRIQVGFVQNNKENAICVWDTFFDKPPMGGMDICDNSFFNMHWLDMRSLDKDGAMVVQ